MKPLFPGAGEIEQAVSSARLDMLQAQLRETQATCLLELCLDATRQVVLLYAHGALAGAYQCAENRSEPITLASLRALWKNDATLRKVDLPDQAGRMLWLACEFSKRESYQLTEANWAANLRQWKTQGLNGLVQLCSDRTQAFLLFWHGDEMVNETTFFDGQSFSCHAAIPLGQSEVWEATIFTANPSAISHHCFHLRTSACQWGNAVLESYQNIAGRKFLQVMERDIQNQLRPLHWNIQLQDKFINDQHFFPGPDAVAHAYRAIFMQLGAQMSFAIGDYLTQRILSDMFRELSMDEQTVLESHRLIPAAFVA